MQWQIHSDLLLNYPPFTPLFDSLTNSTFINLGGDSFSTGFFNNLYSNYSNVSTPNQTPTYISTLVDGITHETFLSDFTAYCNEVATSSPKQTFGGSVFEDMGPTFTLLETEIRRRHIK